MKRPLIRKLVSSPHLDVLGASLILTVCLWRGFHETFYCDGEILFGVKPREWLSIVKQGGFPLGMLSIIGAIFSMLATRFTGKQQNRGNMIGVITTVNSGGLDYLFGNHSAIITYPITFLLQSFAFAKWEKGEKIRARDTFYYSVVSVGMVLGFALVYLGAYLFGGKSDDGFLIIVSLTFGLSLGANFSNAFKYQETWLSWAIYNIIQLIKNVMLLNLANVVKYMFYLFNSCITLVDWKLNGDRLDINKT